MALNGAATRSAALAKIALRQIVRLDVLVIRPPKEQGAAYRIRTLPPPAAIHGLCHQGNKFTMAQWLEAQPIFEDHGKFIRTGI
jgi:hypothetical protein